MAKMGKAATLSPPWMHLYEILSRPDAYTDHDVAPCSVCHKSCPINGPADEFGLDIGAAGLSCLDNTSIGAHDGLGGAATLPGMSHVKGFTVDKNDAEVMECAPTWEAHTFMQL